MITLLQLYLTKETIVMNISKVTTLVLVSMVAVYGCGKENQSAQSQTAKPAASSEAARPAEPSMSEVSCNLNSGRTTIEVSFSESPAKVLKYGSAMAESSVDSARVKWMEDVGGKKVYWDLDRISGDIKATSLELGTIYTGQCAKKGAAKF